MWIIFVLLTIFTWGSYNILTKISGTQIHPFLALFFIGLAQVLISFPLIIYQKSVSALGATTKGIILALTMGAVFGLGTVFFFLAFKYGAPVSLAIAVYTTGALLLGVIAGIIFYQEPINLKIISGIILAVASIILLTLNK